MVGKRFAVLLCAEDPEYVKKKHGGYFGVFVKMLGEEGEIWDSYRVTAGHFPDDADIGIYDGFVVTGSCSDAHSNDPWICQLLLLLKKLNALKKKVLGICFGHQVRKIKSLQLLFFLGYGYKFLSLMVIKCYDLISIIIVEYLVVENGR